MVHNETDVGGVENLGPVWQRHSPQLRCRMQQIDVAFAAKELATERFPNKVIVFESAILGLVDLILFYFELEHVVIAKEDNDSVPYFHRVLVASKAHGFIINGSQMETQGQFSGKKL